MVLVAVVVVVAVVLFTEIISLMHDAFAKCDILYNIVSIHLPCILLVDCVETGIHVITLIYCIVCLMHSHLTSYCQVGGLIMKGHAYFCFYTWMNDSLCVITCIVYMDLLDLHIYIVRAFCFSRCFCHLSVSRQISKTKRDRRKILSPL